MDIESVLLYIDEFIEFVKPVGGLVKTWFENMYINIPEFKKLFLVTIGLGLLSVGIEFFVRVVSD